MDHGTRSRRVPELAEVPSSRFSRTLAFTLSRAGAAQDRLADAQRLGVKQNESDTGTLVAAIGPGMVGAALDHDVAGLQRYFGLIHVHFDLALQHDHIID